MEKKYDKRPSIPLLLLFSLSVFHTIFNVGRESHAQDWIPVEELLLYIKLKTH